jgi:hypothetical protein
MLPIVRTAVRDLLMSAPAYYQLSANEQRQLASLLVKVCQTAAALLVEEVESDQQAREASHSAVSPPIAQALTAGDEFSGAAVDRVAGTVRGIINAVSFPRFVTELINGVFKSMIEANVQQMQSFVELLNDVSASLEGFADTNVGPDRARQWLVDSFPGSFELGGDVEEAEEQRRLPPEEREPVEITVRLRSNAQMPSEAALRARLGLDEGESVPTGDPERGLVPLARRALAGQRQQMLATMVMLGMQRIVIDSGRINAAMRFHVDASSAAQQDKGSMFDFRNTTSAQGRFGAGPWGVSASMTNTIGYASTEQTSTTERLDSRVEMNSSVELVFHTDYLPLNRVTTEAQANRIRNNSLNPQIEQQVARDARAAETTNTQQRRDLISERLRAAPNVSAPPLPSLPEERPSRPVAPSPQPVAGGERPAASTTPPPAGSTTPSRRPEASSTPPTTQPRTSNPAPARA